MIIGYARCSPDEQTKPFWVSEHVDAFPDGDITWSKEKLLEQPGARRIPDAYQTYKNTGKYDPEDHMWFTAHNSTYDIANKALWVTIRENYEKHYEFTLFLLVPCPVRADFSSCP